MATDGKAVEIRVIRDMRHENSAFHDEKAEAILADNASQKAVPPFLRRRGKQKWFPVSILFVRQIFVFAGLAGALERMRLENALAF